MAHRSHEEVSLAGLLLDYLKELSGAQLKEFKFRLSTPVYKELKPIPWGQLEDIKDEPDIASIMRSFYSEDSALKVMLEILGKMNLNDLALRLNKDLQWSNEAGRELGDRTTGPCASVQMDDELQSKCDIQSKKYRDVQRQIKSRLKEKFQCIFETLPKQGKTIFLNDIYTELYITEAGNGGVNNEHAIRQIETEFWKNASPEHTIKCSDIFKPLPSQRKHIRTVLTRGIAGIGKTVSVQKFVLDWAEERENQDMDFVFTLPFRDLNRMKEKQCSLIQLIHRHFPEIKEMEKILWENLKTVFILDGLDECRLPLNFKDNETWSDATETTTVDVLLTNLITGNLLPSALLWITSRPAATNQIPPDCIQQLTEVRGFNDAQKEEYFTKRFSNKVLGNKIFEHIKTSRTLFIMCHIPIFCWISAAVLEKLIDEEVNNEIPQTLTQMYTHFLLIQISLKKQKYQGNYVRNSKLLLKEDKEMILKLGELSFHGLEKGKLIFYEDDLESYGIDVRDASVYSHLCTEIFIEESKFYQEKAYCFIHLTFQEYLAALYAVYKFTQENKNVLHPYYGVEKQEQCEVTNKHDVKEEKNNIFQMCKFIHRLSKRKRASLPTLHKSAIYLALLSENGHLDLFLRFLLGFSLESNQTLLEGLLTSTRNANWSAKVTVKYIKKTIKVDYPPDRIINFFHCLNELNDHSLVAEIQTYLKARNLTDTKLEPYQCSALSFVLLTKEDVLEDFDFKAYGDAIICLERLLPVLKICRNAMLDSCNLRDSSFELVASALKVTNHVRELNLSYNVLRDTGLTFLARQLSSPHCRLQTLRLSSCYITKVGCEILASALSLNASHLRELDLSYNDVGDGGVRVLCAELIRAGCKLEKLKLGNCCLTEVCCGDLALLLRFELRELELRDNDLKDSGVKLLCGGLEDPKCGLQRLGLSGCWVTEEGCVFLSQALHSNPSHLRELDLSYNHPGDSGLTMISAVQEDPSCVLEKLFDDHCGEDRDKPGLQKYFCSISLDPLTAHMCLSLSDGDRTVTCEDIWTERYPNHPDWFQNEIQVMSRESLSSRCYWEVRVRGRVEVGVAYPGFPWKYDSPGNKKSWLLHCFGMGDNSLCHIRKRARLQRLPFDLETLGVYLDFQAGTLSFYKVSPDTKTHLYSYSIAFTEQPHALIRLTLPASASLHNI
nr:NACHT, LRR and PYD domains-containing protein 3-like isoform X1 [Paramormyrops kingsleyae]XP_023685249.1 NACHT, LRR and PYD domains-containing protein 3-like isoform X1 [Paramormyrops kingsleyae]XP_023685250.1 NACHT, LRR and PYD domains-containing protein 3-like isoform X1 [Paramormyrops kingsleyae]XP_023685251.1 NACHT, LRR and PYD domains-containing protein 3-like isoform X1 [Paramormyrops kingsleyae]XP_023685252.1 NACHT, LRR and PYD domains-containing protein 3-like isoform X1 [Paramormyro